MLSKSQRDELRGLHEDWSDKRGELDLSELCEGPADEAMEYLPALLDAADELERLREGLQRLSRKQRNEAERSRQMAGNPKRTATSIALCLESKRTHNEFADDITALLNDGGDDGN